MPFLKDLTGLKGRFKKKTSGKNASPIKASAGKHGEKLQGKNRINMLSMYKISIGKINLNILKYLGGFFSTINNKLPFCTQ